MLEHITLSTTLQKQIDTLEKERKELQDTFLSVYKNDEDDETAEVTLKLDLFLTSKLWIQSGNSIRRYCDLLLFEDQARAEQIRTLTETLVSCNTAAEHPTHSIQIAKDEKVELARIAKAGKVELAQISKAEKVELAQISKHKDLEAMKIDHDTTIRLAELAQQERIRLKELRLRGVELEKETMLMSAELGLEAEVVNAKREKHAQEMHTNEHKALASSDRVQHTTATNAATRVTEDVSVAGTYDALEANTDAYINVGACVDEVRGDLGGTLVLASPASKAQDEMTREAAVQSGMSLADGGHPGKVEGPEDTTPGAAAHGPSTEENLFPEQNEEFKTEATSFEETIEAGEICDDENSVFVEWLRQWHKRY
ncbi:hypothetical protein BC939DRAFT_437011 [Gamsiella multidivaricata]|uniref:uncharacterized protein n=1 Tax=Gamsiella multidivaricata TaxID=101098 RepID=UPI00221E6423|nr:uncharacterized protein BC939DRAFT_437011 [Gamsiella multidivaricata]KAG0365925.1 hypothetical protein BGZ54_006053 [Gamsiella multidivaricata]KAI7831438.1 hypothetical protein BC939DRAFT_437011 [Gamsiella multidivaricata]